MKEVSGFIKKKKIDLPSGEPIHLTSSIEQLIEEERKLYNDAFKNNIALVGRVAWL